jgi:16S rRNA (cytosine1402-N4)-methyltransferase
VILITQPNEKHVPVLLERVLEVLNPRPGESYLDMTVGYGGHARAVIDRTGAPEKAVLVDRDTNALASVSDLQDLGATPMHSDFATATEELGKSGRTFDMILADFGVSSPHLDNADRGFSFMREGPLDMRMDRTQATTAADIVNSYKKHELVDILRKFGEEPQAEKIAAAIVSHKPFETTTQLADVIEETIPRWGKTHPATRTFQAIRMAVNTELDQIESTLNRVESLMTPGSRLAIISFHSLEDRIVKTFFKERCKSGYESTMDLITKRPILGTEEIDLYPRSRSAVLRAAVKK